ncbi:protein-glutamine glutaminase family protein [Actinopolyspora halophila]|uniref:protein-glutamine glutaminase family protein n=1 Tax=Actinopolyspora halophila TaxID=1850 RepID=UPI000369BB11|nr:protein-glutamine glutaminase family protein [Actinopolyspora halophila]
MPTELPEGLQKALEIVGGQRWPEGDEDGLRRMSTAWSDISAAIDKLEAAVDRSANDIGTTMHGEFSDAYGKYVTDTLRPMLRNLRAKTDNHSEFTKNTAADIQYAKISIIVQLVIVAATLAFSWLPGIGQAITAAAAATARAVITSIFRTVLQNIIAGAAAGVALEVGLDAVIQGMQMLTGVRTDWNEDFTKGAALGGALGGAMGGAVYGAFRGIGGFARGGIGDVSGSGVDNVTGNLAKGFDDKVVRGPSAEGAEGILGQGAKNFLDTTGGKLGFDAANIVGQGGAGLAADGATNSALGSEEWNPFSFTSSMADGFEKRGDGTNSSYGGGNAESGTNINGLNGLGDFDDVDTDLPGTEGLPKTIGAPEGVTHGEGTDFDSYSSWTGEDSDGSTLDNGASEKSWLSGTTLGAAETTRNSFGPGPNGVDQSSSARSNETGDSESTASEQRSGNGGHGGNIPHEGSTGVGTNQDRWDSTSGFRNRGWNGITVPVTDGGTSGNGNTPDGDSVVGSQHDTPTENGSQHAPGSYTWQDDNGGADTNGSTSLTSVPEDYSAEQPPPGREQNTVHDETDTTVAVGGRTDAEDTAQQSGPNSTRFQDQHSDPVDPPPRSPAPPREGPGLADDTGVPTSTTDAAGSGGSETTDRSSSTVTESTPSNDAGQHDTRGTSNAEVRQDGSTPLDTGGGTRELDTSPEHNQAAPGSETKQSQEGGERSGSGNTHATTEFRTNDSSASNTIDDESTTVQRTPDGHTHTRPAPEADGPRRDTDTTGSQQRDRTNTPAPDRDAISNHTGSDTRPDGNEASTRPGKPTDSRFDEPSRAPTHVHDETTETAPQPERANGEDTTARPEYDTSITGNTTEHGPTPVVAPQGGNTSPTPGSGTGTNTGNTTPGRPDTADRTAGPPRNTTSSGETAPSGHTTGGEVTPTPSRTDLDGSPVSTTSEGPGAEKATPHPTESDPNSETSRIPNAEKTTGLDEIPENKSESSSTVAPPVDRSGSGSQWNNTGQRGSTGPSVSNHSETAAPGRSTTPSDDAPSKVRTESSNSTNRGDTPRVTGRPSTHSQPTRPTPDSRTTHQTPVDTTGEPNRTGESSRNNSGRDVADDESAPTRPAPTMESNLRAEVLHGLLFTTPVDSGAVLHELHQLRGDQTAIQALQESFRARTGGLDLWMPLALNLDQPSYLRAMDLLGLPRDYVTGPVQPGAPSTSAPPGMGFDPAYNQSVWNFAGQLVQHNSTGRFDDAMTMLHGVGRDIRALWAIQDAYRAQTGSELSSDLMSTAPWRYHEVLHAMGAYSTDPVSMEQASHWHDQLKRSTFEHHARGRTTIRTDHPEDGCYIRAHLWALDLQRMGAAPSKIFVARINPPLSVRTPHSADALPGLPGQLNWSFHVAPSVTVSTPNGPKLHVLDPSTSDAPLSFDNWLSNMNVEVASETTQILGGSPQRIQQVIDADFMGDPAGWGLATNNSWMPSGRAMVIASDPSALFFPQPWNPAQNPQSLQGADTQVRERYEDLLVQHNDSAQQRAEYRTRLEHLLNNVGAIHQSDPGSLSIDPNDPNSLSFDPTNLTGNGNDLFTSGTFAPNVANEFDEMLNDPGFNALLNNTTGGFDPHALGTDNFDRNGFDGDGPGPNGPDPNDGGNHGEHGVSGPGSVPPNAPPSDGTVNPGALFAPDSSSSRIFAEWNDPHTFRDRSGGSGSRPAPLGTDENTSTSDRAEDTSSREHDSNTGGDEPSSWDRSWKHSTASTASWFEPDTTPVRPEQWNEQREHTPAHEVATEVRDVRMNSTANNLEYYEGRIRYDLRHMDVAGQGVQEYTFRAHLSPDPAITPEQLGGLRDRLSETVDNLFNQGNRLPSGDRFHVRVEFVDSPAEAHDTIRVSGGGHTNQTHWNVHASPNTHAHEIGHYLGLPDESPDPRGSLDDPDTRRVFNRGDPPRATDVRTGEPHPSRNSVLLDNGLMGHSADHDPHLKPRHLWNIENTAHSQGARPDITPRPNSTPPFPEEPATAHPESRNDEDGDRQPSAPRETDRTDTPENDTSPPPTITLTKPDRTQEQLVTPGDRGAEAGEPRAPEERNTEPLPSEERSHSLPPDVHGSTENRDNSSTATHDDAGNSTPEVSRDRSSVRNERGGQVDDSSTRPLDDSWGTRSGQAARIRPAENDATPTPHVDPAQSRPNRLPPIPEEIELETFHQRPDIEHPSPNTSSTTTNRYSDESAEQQPARSDHTDEEPAGFVRPHETTDYGTHTTHTANEQREDPDATTSEPAAPPPPTRLPPIPEEDEPGVVRQQSDGDEPNPGADAAGHHTTNEGTEHQREPGSFTDEVLAEFDRVHEAADDQVPAPLATTARPETNEQPTSDPVPPPRGTNTESSREIPLDRIRADRPKVDGDIDGTSVRESVLELLTGNEQLRGNPNLRDFVEVAFSDENLRKKFHDSADGSYEVDLGPRAGKHGGRVSLDVVGLREAARNDSREGTEEFTSSRTHDSSRHSSTNKRSPLGTGGFNIRIPWLHLLTQLQVAGLINSRDSGLTAQNSHEKTTALTEHGRPSRTVEHTVDYRITLRTPGRFSWNDEVTQHGAADAKARLTWPDDTARDSTGEPWRHPGEIEHVELSGLGDVHRAVSEELGLRVGDPAGRELRDWLRSLGEEVFEGPVRKSFSFGGKRAPTEIVVGIADGASAQRLSDVEGTVERTAKDAAESTSEQANTRQRGGGLWVAAGDITGLTGALVGPNVSHVRSTRNENALTGGHERETTSGYRGRLNKQRLGVQYLVRVGDEQREVPNDEPHQDNEPNRDNERATGENVGPPAPRSVKRYAPERLLRVEGTATVWTRGTDGGTTQDSPTAEGERSPDRAGETSGNETPGTPRREPTADPVGADRHRVPDRLDAHQRLPEQTVQAITGPVLSKLHADGTLPGKDLPDLAERLNSFVRNHPGELTGGDGLRLPLGSMHPGAPDVFVRGAMDRAGARYLGSPDGESVKSRLGGHDEHSAGREHGRTTTAGISGITPASITNPVGPDQHNNFSGLQTAVETTNARGETTSHKSGYDRSSESSPVHEFSYPTEFEVRIGGRWSDRPDPSTTSTISSEVRVSVPERTEVRFDEPRSEPDTTDAGRENRSAGEGPRNTGRENHGDGTTGSWQRGRAPRREREGHLPAGFELETLKPVPGLRRTMTDMLGAVTGSRWPGRLTAPFVGGRPAAFDESVNHGMTSSRDRSSGALDEHNAALDAMESFTSTDARAARFERAALHRDTAWLKSHNPGGMMGNRELTTRADLSTRLDTPRVVARDDAHRFGGSDERAERALGSKAKRNRNYRAGIDITHYFSSGNPAALIGPSFEAGGKYTTENAETSKSETAKSSSSHHHSERGYLVRYDAVHEVRTSTRHSWQDPFRLLHRGAPEERSKWVRVRDAVEAWVPASELHQVGRLGESDIERLTEEDAEHYRSNTEHSDAERSGTDTGPPQGTAFESTPRAPQHNDGSGTTTDEERSTVRPPANVGRGSGRVELYRLGAARELLEQVQQRLDGWSREHGRPGARARMLDLAYEALGKPRLQRQPSVPKFDAINERVVDEVLGQLGSRHGFNNAVEEMLNGGRQIHLTGDTPFGKVEQLVVLHARPGAGQYQRTLSDRTTTESHGTSHATDRGDQRGWDFNTMLGVSPFYGTSGNPGSVHMHGLTGAYSSKRGFENTASTEHSAAATGKEDGVQFLHDLTIDMEVYPYARPGTYSNHLGAWFDRIAPRRFGEPWRSSFELRGAARSTVPTSEVLPADGTVPAPRTRVDGSFLQNRGDRADQPAWSPGEKVRARPFAAPALHHELGKLAHGDPELDPPRPGLRPGNAARLHTATDVGHLRSNLRNALSTGGHTVELAGGHLESVRINADLSRRELLGEIKQDSLSNTDTEQRATKSTAQRGGQAGAMSSMDFRQPGLEGAPLRPHQGLVSINRTLGDWNSSQEAENSTTEESTGRSEEPRYLVRVTPEWELTPSYRGKNPTEWEQPLRTGPDEPILVEVDRTGLIRLGLHESVQPSEAAEERAPESTVEQAPESSSDRSERTGAEDAPAGEVRPLRENHTGEAPPQSALASFLAPSPPAGGQDGG